MKKLWIIAIMVIIIVLALGDYYWWWQKKIIAPQETELIKPRVDQGAVDLIKNFMRPQNEHDGQGGVRIAQFDPLPAGYNLKFFLDIPNNNLYARDAKTNQKFWMTKTSALGNAKIIDATLYLEQITKGGASGFEAFDIATGRKLWSLDIGVSNVFGTFGEYDILAKDNLIYVSNITGIKASDLGLLAIDKKSGKIIWKFDKSAKDLVPLSTDRPGILLNNILYVASSDENLYGLDPLTGKIISKFAIGYIIDVATDGDFLYSIVNDASQLHGINILYSINPASGNVNWKIPINAYYLTKTYIDRSKNFMIIADHSDLTAIDTKQGVILWHLTSKSDFQTSPILSGNAVYVGTFTYAGLSEYGIDIIDLRSGKILQQLPSGIPQE